MEREENDWSLEKAQEFALSKFRREKGIPTKGTISWKTVLEVLKAGVNCGYKFAENRQQEISYTKEDMISFAKMCKSYSTSRDVEKVFEQFKKK